MNNLLKAGVLFEPGTFHSKWVIGEEQDLANCTGVLHDFTPIESDGIVVNATKGGDIIGTKYPGRPDSEPYWIGDEREGGSYRHALVRKIEGKTYAIF